jgi:hypothetical protein
MARTVLWIAGERDFLRAIKKVKNIHEELALISDRSDAVGVYLQSNESSDVNRYFILIDNPREVVAVELKGYIDPEILQARAEKLTNTN